MDLKQLTKLKDDKDYYLIKTQYVRGNKELKLHDMLYLIYKDRNSLNKKLIKIQQPCIEGYIAKDDVDITHELIKIKEEDVDKVDLNYNSIVFELAKKYPELRTYCTQILETKNYKALRNIHKYPTFFSTDVDIEDFYNIKSLETFGQFDVINNITKGFVDIEVDLMEGDVDLDEGTGYAPINVVTYISQNSPSDINSYTFILRNRKNPLVQELEDDIDNFMTEIHETFDNDFPGIKYGIKFYDDELDLITELFNVINYHKNDYVMPWNMRFDYRYIIDRIRKLGGSVHDIICHKDFERRVCYFYADESKNAKIDVRKRNDSFTVSSYTSFIDQMILYAKVRKHKSYSTYGLDFISEHELGTGKLKYSDIGSIKTFPYRDFRKFVLYNIKDVLLQYGIEKKVRDVDFMFSKAYESGTRVSKVFNETIYLRNLYFIEFKEQGFILGNNHNIDYGYDNIDDEPREKYEGAVVGNPKLNRPVGLKLLGKFSTKLFNMVADEDIESMYPTNIEQNNIFHDTQHGRVIMDKNNITEREHRSIDDFATYDRGGKFLEDLELREPLLFEWRWHNLPSAEELLLSFEQYVSKNYINNTKLFKKKSKKLFKK